jgi:PAS domain S-box-containing protein
VTPHVNAAICRRLQRIAAIMGIAVALVGADVLIGRIVGIPALYHFFGAIVMKANTALCLMLGGIALAGSFYRTLPAERRIRQVLGLIVAVIGSLTLMEHLTGVDVGIDQILVREAPGEAATASPGRMGPPASFSFAVLGTALIVLELRSSGGLMPSQLLALLAGLVSLVPLAGYTFGIDTFYQLAQLTGIALETALCLGALSLGILFTTSDRGLMSVVTANHSGGALARRLLPPAVILPMALGALSLAGQRRGYYTTPEATALLVITLIALFSAMIWWAARVSGGLAEARDRARDAEAETNRRIVQILEAISQAFISLDTHGRYTYLNRHAEQMLNISRDDLLGRKMSEVSGESVGAALLADIERARTEHTGVQCEHVLPRTNHWYEHFIMPTRYGISIFAQDITERRQRDEERRQLLEAERAARSEAQRASSMKDEFLATLSHELRTPLNAIVGWAHLLTSRNVDPLRLSEGLAAIHRNSRVQAQLIEDLLDMSRIVSGKVRLDVQRIEPATVLENALDSVRPAAEAKQIRLQSILDPDAGAIMADPARLQQIVWNLLSNSIKFTPRGGRVSLVLRRARSAVEIIVTDNGQGIRQEVLPHIFERFRQGDSSSTRAHGGLGLGLAIVRHLTELHGGTISATSEGEGRGAEFTVRLPVMSVARPDDSASGSSQASAAINGAAREHLLHGLKVLVVDDEPDARALLRRVLEDAEAHVRTASSVPEALELWKHDKPHVLVSDIGMPGQDGYELIRAVRAMEPDGRSVAALALTAFARAEDRKRALLAGFHMHLSKPVDPTELTLVVANLAGRT